MVLVLDIDGKPSTETDKRAIAKVSDDGNHYIKVHRGALVDPFGIDSGKVSTSDYKRVSERTYRMFSDYLQSRNVLKYLQAERSYREQE
jgi:hypothetical protein